MKHATPNYFQFFDADIFAHILHLHEIEPPVWEDQGRAADETRRRNRKPGPRRIAAVIAKSDIRTQADILQTYLPDPRAKLDKLFDRDGRTFAYYVLDCPNAQFVHRYWWRYRVENGRPVIDAVFPVTIRNAQ